MVLMMTEMTKRDEDFRGTDSASTDNVSYAVNTSDVENQQLTEGSDSRQENLNQDEVNLPEQRSAHCTSESVGIVTGTQSRHPEFEMFAARLQTYLGCPQSLQGKAHDLATAGFFYTGVKDHTICFFCGRVLKDWETEDEPWIEHARWFPDCSFVIKNQQQKLADYDLDSLRQRQHSQQQSSPNKLQQPNRPVQPTDNCVSKSNCSSSDHIHQPMHPQFANLALRRNTFQEAVFLNDQQMAEAGFFYKEPGLLICFHCGGHLFTWKPGVNLWNEHARLFPNCTYLNAHRDQNFIMDVIKRFEETTPQRSSKLTHRRNNLETSNPQSPTASGHTDDKGNRFDTSSKMDQDKRAKEALLKHMNTQQNPTPSPRQDQNLPIPFGTQTQENLQVRLSQSVLVENAQEQMLRPAVISNRNTSQIAQNRTVYSSRVTRHTHTGQVIERYPWNLICKLCQEHLADVTFFPCGHTVCCRRCSRNASVCCECHRAIERTENV
ncbi:E3 ubiquitin-protein ligase XIAP-like isoform X2 [Pecten maximus]|uniref:E3 ubiquitin-protein ligase XIAP-like isoform X2 n=1 Tax=Pecten maximus TaxID=6579 RepID=UPI0014581911|nr:E3 ubiquitin-protein ligase XIAP-like isoform X2 [Pecten maximus]